MPELPEVEYAASIARRVALGRTITRVTLHHRAQRRTLPPRQARTLEGDQVVAVVRRGKEQVFHLGSGRELHVHFRMTGDWLVPGPDPLPPTVRAVIAFSDGTQLALDDPRALSVLSLCTVPDESSDLGPDALEPAFNRASLLRSVARRRAPIKVALLDQSVVAGIGNIYASEALWRARIDPRLPASRLASDQASLLVRAVRATLKEALRRQERYYGASAPASDSRRFRVYDREGEPCRRCRSTIRRIVQAARSTYFCPTCQNAKAR